MDEEYTDQSTEKLINNTKLYIEVNSSKKNNVKLKIVIWFILLLSSCLALTSLVLIITSCQRFMVYLTGDEDFGSIINDFDPYNGIHIQTSQKKATFVVTRLPLPTVSLDLHFQVSSNESTKDDNNYTIHESCDDQVPGALQCIYWPGTHTIRLTIFDIEVQGAECFNISLTVSGDLKARTSACLNLHGKQLYGGPTVVEQHWPSQTSKPLEHIVYLSGYGNDITGVVERFWLTSHGEALYIPPDIPLFITQNSSQLCVESQLKPPYHRKGASPEVGLNAVFCNAPDARQVFLATSRMFLGRPTELPDERMLQYPIWSTWAKFKTKIDADTIIKFAQNITMFGFPNSQLEIDDNWETCYGDREFNKLLFPNASAMIESLHNLGFRATLWIHPFQNVECDSYKEARDLNLLVHGPDHKNATDIVTWWNGKAGLLDFTDPRTTKWFENRIRYLREAYNIDGFKFDAGEANYTPELAILHGLENLQPISLTIEYAKTVARLDPTMAEMHSLFVSQKLPIIVRMDDKASVWGYDNGLATLIPVLLTLNMVGYSVIIPDMIGGNGYDGVYPDKELYIRWLQVSTFMPVMQFSYVPWDYDNETLTIAKKYVNLHGNFLNHFLNLANQQIQDGIPINPPIWWIAPNDVVAQTIDSEFLLGETLLVAPVLTKGARSRDVYLPQGTWREGLRPDAPYVEGPVWLRNLSAPLDYLPFFELVESDISKLEIIQLA